MTEMKSAAIQHVDVLIVGSGPAGTSTALHLIRKDPTWAERIVIVDKAIHPREKLCGGGVTHIGQNILADMGLAFEPKSFEVREVRLLYQDKQYAFRGDPVFRIVRRDEFDHWLVKKAEQAGVPVRQGEAVKDVIQHDDYVEVVTSETTFHAKTVVAADGSKSFVRTRLKWEDDSRVSRLIEVLTPEKSTQWEFDEAVAIFDFTKMTDKLQGYYWDFPSLVDGKPVMNRGVFDSRVRPEKPKANLKEDLGEMMAVRERDLDDYKLKGAPIRMFNKDGKFADHRVLLVGDAAGADPLFGEGISFALGYGAPAADAIVEAFSDDTFSYDAYRDKVLADPLFKQLHMRVRLARFAYLMKYPRFVRAGWTVAGWVIALTPWRDPKFVPARMPELTVQTV